VPENLTDEESPERSDLSSPMLTRSGPQNGSRATALVTLGVVGVVAVALSASGVFEGDGAPGVDPGASSTSTSTSSPTPQETPDEPLGTPQNPLRPGDSFTFFDDWTFTLGETDTDAWPDLAPYYRERFPDEIHQHEPEPGMIYVTAEMTAVYDGPISKQDLLNTALHHVSVDGAETYVNGCRLAGGEGRRFDTTELRNQPVVEGYLCAEITPEQVPGGLWWIYLSYYDPAAGIDRNEQYYYTAE
jgi:hypothetical protein